MGILTKKVNPVITYGYISSKNMHSAHVKIGDTQFIGFGDSQSAALGNLVRQVKDQGLLEQLYPGDIEWMQSLFDFLALIALFVALAAILAGILSVLINSSNG